MCEIYVIISDGRAVSDQTSRCELATDSNVSQGSNTTSS